MKERLDEQSGYSKDRLRLRKRREANRKNEKLEKENTQKTHYGRECILWGQGILQKSDIKLMKGLNGAIWKRNKSSDGIDLPRLIE